ncbi:MAG TPA: hypothetical protein VF718_05770 [Allosphingosinicella sp.]|jgi:DNA-binding transcriptional regulator YiaG
MMTGDEVKAIFKGLGLTQSELASWLLLTGGDPGQTVRSWETERRPGSGPAEVALRSFQTGFRPPHIADEEKPPG